MAAVHAEADTEVTMVVTEVAVTRLHRPVAEVVAGEVMVAVAVEADMETVAEVVDTGTVAEVVVVVDTRAVTEVDMEAEDTTKGVTVVEDMAVVMVVAAVMVVVAVVIRMMTPPALPAACLPDPPRSNHDPERL